MKQALSDRIQCKAFAVPLLPVMYDRSDCGRLQLPNHRIRARATGNPLQDQQRIAAWQQPADLQESSSRRVHVLDRQYAVHFIHSIDLLTLINK